MGVAGELKGKLVRGKVVLGGWMEGWVVAS